MAERADALARERAALARAAYARDAGPEQVAALMRFDAEHARPPARLSDEIPMAEPDEPVPFGWSRRWVVGVLVIAALVVGAVVGDRLGSTAVPVAAPTVTVTASPTATPTGSPEPVRALALLGGSQHANDVPPVALPPDIVKSSVRWVDIGQSRDKRPGEASAYVAMNTSAQFCLLLASDESMKTACTFPDPFPAAGLSIYTEANGTDNYAKLRPDGGVELSYNAENGVGAP